MPSFRLCTVALLGCGSTLALSHPQVAFQQHGVVEGGDPVMMAPSKARGHEMSPGLLASAVARMMSLDAKADVGVQLPAGDMFNVPHGNILMFVDGMHSHKESDFTPFLSEMIRESPGTYSLRVPNRERYESSVLPAILNEDFDVMDMPGANGGVACASVGAVLHYTDACMGAQRVSGHPWRFGAGGAGGAGVGAEELLPSDAVGGLILQRGEAESEWVFHTPGRQGEGTGALELDVSIEADKALMEELLLLGHLPEALSALLDDSAPALAIVHLSSLEGVATRHGKRSEKGRLAYEALDTALAHSIHAMAGGAGRRLTSQLVTGASLGVGGAFEAMGGRRLAVDNSTTSTSSNYTVAEISQYQLNLWTGFFLVAMAFLAIYMVLTMDIQPDSLLTAKFAADTSGSGLKVD